MEIREIQLKIQELLLNAVTESKLFKTVYDFMAWSQLISASLDEFYKTVLKEFGLADDGQQENINIFFEDLS